MPDIKVIIDNKIADLPESGLNLPLTYSIKSRDGITTNTGSRSEYAFELPSTKQNDEIFNRFYDTGTITINEQIFLDASIEVDGMPFFIGKCQLQSVTLMQDAYLWRGKVYKVAFFGTNSDWVIRVGDLRLADLPFTAHVYDYPDVLAAWDYKYPTNDYKYLPIKLKDYTTIGQLDVLEDSHPALFIVDILNKIFNSIGYTMESDFFNTNFAKSLILPIPLLSRYLSGLYGEDYLNVSANSSVPQTLVSPFNYIPFVLDAQSSAPAVGANPFNTGTYQYTVPQNGFYLCRFTAIVTNTISPCGYGLYVTKNGAAATLALPLFQNGTFVYESVVQANAGDILALRADDVLISNQMDVQAYLEIIGEADIVGGITLDFKYLINKDWKAIDFIRGLAHAFNLCFESIEGERKVYIEPADTYLNENRSPNSRSLEDGFYNSETDLTQYVDLSKGGEIMNDTKQLDSIRMKWKDDSNDATVEAINENQSLGILEARYVYPDNRYKKGETVIENPFFAATLVIADNEIISSTSAKTPMIPIIWAENYLETSTSSETVQEIEPRILVSGDRTKGKPNGEINVYDGVGVVTVNTPLSYMIDYNDTAGYQISLSFADEVVNGFNIGGLMKRFYLSDLMRLESGKYLEIFLLWDIVMLRNLTFREKIVIGGDKYILQEINSFSVTKNGSTKTYLQYDYREPDAEDSIENTILTAKVNN